MTKINVKVKAMNGQQIELQVEPEIDVEEFRKLLAEKSSTAPHQQRLIYQGKVLKNGTKLSDYKISNDHVIHLVNMPPEAQQTGSSSSSTTTTTGAGATSGTTTPSPNTGAHPHAQAFRALGPGMVITGIVDSNSPTSNNNQRGGIDISSILNSVLGGILQPGANANNNNNHGHSHSHPHTHNNQPTAQRQQQQQQTTTTTNSSSQARSIVNGARSIINFLNNEQQRQNIVRSLESVVSNLSESTPNRLAANLARNEVLPTLQQLQRDLGSFINSRNNTTTTTSNSGNQGSTHSEPTINGVNLNLHVNANELDQLPNQLDRLHNIIHNSPLGPRPQPVEQPILITTSTTTVNRTAQQQPSQQTTTSQPSQTTSQQTSTPPTTQNTTTQPPTQQFSLNSLMERAMSSFGVNLTETNESERSVFDRLISVATDGLQITDLLGIMSGNWAPLESTKGRMRDFVISEVLKEDTSPENLQEKVEELMTDFETYMDKNHDLQLEIASRAGESDVIDLLTQIVRNYVTLFFKLIIEEPSKYSTISNGTIDGTVQNPFATALNRFTTLALGEVVELFETHCTSGSSSVLLPLLLDSMFNSLPSNVQMFYRTQGSSVIASFAAQRHQQYKTLYPNRPLTFMPKPVITKKVVKPEETKKEESKPQVSSDSDKMLEELMSKDSMDLLDSVSFDDIIEKPVAESSKPTPVVETPKPVVETQKAKSPTTASTPANNDWKNGLSEEEINEINNTIDQDQAIMELTSDETQKVSDSYKMSSTQSGYVKKEKEEPSTGGRVPPPSKQEDEDVDLD